MVEATARDFADLGDDNVIRGAIDSARKPTAPRLVSATPYAWRSPSSIPLRPWLYGRQLLRGTASALLASTGMGKTALLVGTALACVTGRPLLGKEVWGGPQRVWIWNLEDSVEDIARLVQAAAIHWNISEDDIGERLFIDSALDGAELKMALDDRDGFRIIEPIMDALAAELIARKIDVLIVDPFVSSHGANENDNSAIDAITKKWARVSVAANCSIVLCHHTKKMGGVEASAESSRGASALVSAVRSALVLNRMSEDEALRYGIEGEKRRRYFRAYDDKANRAPPADASDWYHLASVDLGNGLHGGDGDSIQVVVPWTPPDTFDGVTLDHLRAVQNAVHAGSWLKSEQSPEWVGHPVADVLGLNAKKDAPRIRRLLREWIANGALEEDRRADKAKGRERPYIVVGKWADDNSPPSGSPVGSGWGSGESRPHPTPPIKGGGGGGVTASDGEKEERRILSPVFAADGVRRRAPILAPGETGDEPVPGFEE